MEKIGWMCHICGTINGWKYTECQKCGYKGSEKK